MSGDPLALQKDLDGARRQPHLDLAAGKAVGDAVEMALELGRARAKTGRTNTLP
jgi:hypothetical protein